MENIEVAVSPDAEEVYLAFSKGWTKLFGHSITVGDLKFSAVPVSDYILVSEFQSGTKLMDIPVPTGIESYEETMFFLEVFVSSQIVMVIEKSGIDKVKDQIKRMKEAAFKKHGQKPTGEKVDSEWFYADTGDAVN